VKSRSRDRQQDRPGRVRVDGGGVNWL